MGVFNFFIVIPQIISGLLLGLFTNYAFDGNTVKTIMLGGCCMVLAGIIILFVNDEAGKTQHAF